MPGTCSSRLSDPSHLPIGLTLYEIAIPCCFEALPTFNLAPWDALDPSFRDLERLRQWRFFYEQFELDFDHGSDCHSDVCDGRNLHHLHCQRDAPLRRVVR